MSDLEMIASKLNKMGFPNKIVGNSIQAELPLPYLGEFAKPSFKLYYSPEQKLIYYQANRYSTDRLLRKLKPQLREITKELGLSFASHEGIS